LAAISPQQGETSVPAEFRRSHFLGLGLLLMVLTVALTWPAVPQLTTHLLGDGDAWQFCWNKWWLAHALWHGQHPFCTDFIYFPPGTCAYLHTWNFPTALAALPLQGLLSLPAITNLLALASFVIAGYGMHRLARWFGLGFGGATLAALAFTFGPYHFSHARGHFNLVHYQWIPFFLYAFLQGTHAGWTRRRILAAAGWLVLIGLTDWYYFVFSLLAAGIIMAVHSVRERRLRWPAFRAGLVVVLLSVLVLSPLLAGMIWQSRQIPAETVSEQYSADLLGFLIPGPVSTYGEAFVPYHRNWSGNPAEWGTFVPWSLLLLSVLGWRHFLPAHRLLLAIWLPLFFFLSLGPYLQLNGEVLRRVPLPYHWLAQVPGLDIMRAPIRFHLMTYLAGCLLYGAGIHSICRRWRRPWPAVLLGILLLAESLCVPVQMSEPDVSPFYESLQTRPLSEAVIDLHYGSRALFYQTVHHKKMMGTTGMLSRESESALRFLRETPAIHEILAANTPVQIRTGWPDQVLPQLDPAIPHEALAIGYIRGRGTLEICTPYPHELRLDGRTIPLAVQTERYVSRVELRDRHLIRLRLQPDRQPQDVTPHPPILFLLEERERRPLSETPARLAVEPYVSSARESGFFWVIYRIDDSPGPPPDTTLAALRQFGFRWIILPFYGNDHLLQTRLGLKPVYTDRWIQAFDLDTVMASDWNGVSQSP